MIDINKVIIQGRLGRDPELRSFPDGTAVCNITVATSMRWKDKRSGEAMEKTEWSRVVLRGRQAEIAAEYLRKGSECYIEGRLETRKWQDKEGRDMHTTEIVAADLKLGSKPKDGDEPQQRSASPTHGERKQQQRAPHQVQQRPADVFEDMDDEIPF